VTLGGQVEMVASDVAEIVRAGSDLGLSLNMDKCELIAHSDLQANDTLLFYCLFWQPSIIYVLF